MRLPAPALILLASCNRAPTIAAVDAENVVVDAAVAHTLVLPYGALGPQAECHELVGFEWYSWEKPGSFELKDTMNISIVVYEGISLADAQRAFPNHEGPPRDPKAIEYRFVSYSAALAYLDRELADEDVKEIPSLHKSLMATRAELIRLFGPKLR